MAKVVATPSLCEEFLGGRGELRIDAGNLFELVRKLDAITPGFGAFIEDRVALAVDGTLVADWTTRLSEDSEVLLVPRIAGGCDPGSPERI